MKGDKIIIVETLTSDNFIESIYATNNNKIIVVQFTANWCQICQQFLSTSEELEKIYNSSNIIFTKVDVDQNSDLAEQYNITKIPTFLFFKNRVLVNFMIGSENINYFKRIINDILNKP